MCSLVESFSKTNILSQEFSTMLGLELKHFECLNLEYLKGEA